ncbi:putative membrane protein [Natronobacillus azotifigens]|uniref:DUF5808 domain-containing protein n=1 Tax=Natronobacillus azotifigens TaxID=472978 RepID=A0A9J6RC74_9BACI|nr:DUF5808 domain-containing protein [Natronobacillus azotifigens]MCZ0702958.1 DUF5808 domain-containing protein [Natronobacillus azotifigens]
MFLIVFLLYLITIYIPLVLIGIFLPLLMKKTLLFGVVIPEELSDREEVVEIRKRYIRNSSISAIFISIVINIFAIMFQSMDVLLMGIIVLIVLFGINYVDVHKKAKTLKAEKKWTIDKKQMVVVNTSKPEEEKNSLSYYWGLPLLIMLFTFLFTFVQYSGLSEEIPHQFDIVGNPVSYRQTNFWNVFLLPLTQLGISITFYGVYKILQKAKISIQARRPLASFIQNQLAKKYWIVYILITNVVLNLYLAYIQLTVLEVITPTTAVNVLIYGFGVAIPVIGAIYVSMKTGQSGNRIKVDVAEEVDDEIIDRDDDQHWKWGLFYYNPHDPTVFIEKRFGIGWTINWGRPLGIVLVLGTIAIIMVSLIPLFR